LYSRRVYSCSLSEECVEKETKPDHFCITRKLHTDNQNADFTLFPKQTHHQDLNGMKIYQKYEAMKIVKRKDN